MQVKLDELFFEISKFSSQKNISFFSIYPFGQNRNNAESTIHTNKYIEFLCSKFNFNYLNIYDSLINQGGFLDCNFSSDGLHLNIVGQNLISRILNENSVCKN